MGGILASQGVMDMCMRVCVGKAQWASADSLMEKHVGGPQAQHTRTLAHQHALQPCTHLIKKGSASSCSDSCSSLQAKVARVLNGGSCLQ